MPAGPRYFAHDIRNTGGRDAVISGMSHHHARLRAAKPTMNTRDPAQERRRQQRAANHQRPSTLHRTGGASYCACAATDPDDVLRHTYERVAEIGGADDFSQQQQQQQQQQQRCSSRPCGTLPLRATARACST